MSEIADLWAKEMQDAAGAVERLILAAAERTRMIEKDALLNGQRQSVTALRNHLFKLADDAAGLRKTFRNDVGEVKESVNKELVAKLRVEQSREPKVG